MLIPNSELPRTDEQMKAKAEALAARYPRDPRLRLFRGAALVSPKAARRQLERRIEAIGERLAQAQSQMQGAHKIGLPRLILVEEEYKQAMLRADLHWTCSLVEALRSKKMYWSEKWLRAAAARFEPNFGE